MRFQFIFKSKFNIASNKTQVSVSANKLALNLSVNLSVSLTSLPLLCLGEDEVRRNERDSVISKHSAPYIHFTPTPTLYLTLLYSTLLHSIVALLLRLEKAATIRTYLSPFVSTILCTILLCCVVFYIRANVRNALLPVDPRSTCIHVYVNSIISSPLISLPQTTWSQTKLI